VNPEGEDVVEKGRPGTSESRFLRPCSSEVKDGPTRGVTKVLLDVEKTAWAQWCLDQIRHVTKNWKIRVEHRVRNGQQSGAKLAGAITHQRFDSFGQFRLYSRPVYGRVAMIAFSSQEEMFRCATVSTSDRNYKNGDRVVPLASI